MLLNNGVFYFWGKFQIISCQIGHFQGTKGTKATEAIKMMENIGKIFFPDDIILTTYSHTALKGFLYFFMGVVCMGDIILPHGGFRHLVVYKKSDVIYQGTVVFCRRFLPPYGSGILSFTRKAMSFIKGRSSSAVVSCRRMAIGPSTR